jgi:hypothetical protein
MIVPAVMFLNSPSFCRGFKPWYASCDITTSIGNNVLFEDDDLRLWNFTLAPGEITPMHRHDCNYYFVVTSGSLLELWSSEGADPVPFEVKNGDLCGFKVHGDYLVPTGTTSMKKIPRTHAAKNIGTSTLSEILIERKPCAFGEWQEISSWLERLIPT